MSSPFHPATVPGSGSGGGGTELTYVEFTANVGCGATTSAGATTIVTAAAVAGDGATKVLIEFFAPTYSASSTGVQGHIGLYEDGTSIGELWVQTAGLSAGASVEAIYVARRMTPSAASHTYSIRAYTPPGGTFTVQAGAGGAATLFPGFIRITTVA